jgi:hypothetical protein
MLRSDQQTVYLLAYTVDLTQAQPHNELVNASAAAFVLQVGPLFPRSTRIQSTMDYAVCMCHPFF